MSASPGNYALITAGTRVAGIAVRVLNMEAHNITSMPTQYPVESGKSISDHVTLNPDVVQIRAEMPNSGGGAEMARGVMMEFVRMNKLRYPVDLMTEHAIYKNMELVALNPLHQAPYKGALIIDLVFQQIGVLGLTDLVSKSGGRPPAILAQDGTQATACPYSNAGEIPPITSGATLAACGRKLSGGAA